MNAQSAFTPTYPPKDILVDVIDANNLLVARKTGPVKYDLSNRTFFGTIDIGSAFAPGYYLIKVKFFNTLRQQAMGIYWISKGSLLMLPKVALKPGDVNNDNQLNILDYNIILDCFSDLSPPRNCSDPAKKTAADITYDGNVNQYDYNLFLLALSVQ